MACCLSGESRDGQQKRGDVKCERVERLYGSAGSNNNTAREFGGKRVAEQQQRG